MSGTTLTDKEKNEKAILEKLLKTYYPELHEDLMDKKKKEEEEAAAKARLI